MPHLGKTLMELRKANLADLAAIMAWVPNESACRMWAGPGIRFPLEVESLSSEMGFSKGDCYCLRRGGVIVAFGQLIEKGNGHFHLARIIVDPSIRNSGVGTILCKRLLQIAGRKEGQTISLNVYRHNATALRLYQNFGFSEVPEKSSAETCYMVKAEAAAAGKRDGRERIRAE